MDTSAPPTSYKHHRFPAEIISHAVWLSFRFCLSYRDVEELLFERGVIVAYEAIRQWCRKFGQEYAHQLRRRRPRPGDKWHMDEVFLTINGERHYLWRAVDQDGHGLDILVQSRRNKKAAKKLFRKLLKGLCTCRGRSSPTDSKATVPRSGRVSRCGAPPARYLDIRPKIPTSRPASGSGACRGLSHQGMHSASSPPMVPSPNTSARDATSSPPRPIEKTWSNASRAGKKLRGSRLRRQRD